MVPKEPLKDAILFAFTSQRQCTVNPKFHNKKRQKKTKIIYSDNTRFQSGLNLQKTNNKLILQHTAVAR